jgi:hypothetical protein
VARVQEQFDRRELLLLAAILIAALALRLYRVDWDEGHHTHPDERWIMMVAETIRWPQNLATAFDPHATTWNPLYDDKLSLETGEYQRRGFAYGHLPLYLLTVVAWAVQSLAQVAAKLGAPTAVIAWMLDANTYAGLPLIGRPLSALFDTGSIFLIYLIGRRTYDRRAGLTAAALAAVTVTQIQLAHFYAFDPVATFFIFLSLYGTLRLAQGGGSGSAILAGVAAGCAISSKFSALPILAPIVVGAAIAAWRGDRDGLLLHATLRTRLWAIVRPILIGWIMAFLAFTLTSPFALLDWPAFAEEVIVMQGAIVSGVVDAPYTRQYRGTLPYLYHIEQQMRWGMGWPLGILAFTGLAWALLRASRQQAQPEEWALLAWVIPYFALTGSFLSKFMRYMLPLVPLFTLMGAAMLWAWWDTRQKGRRIDDRAPDPGRRINDGAWAADLQPPISGIRSPASDLQPPVHGPQSTVHGLRLPSLAWLAPLFLGMTLTFSAFWALAVVHGVYGGTHPWIQASRWIYANAPNGSVILWERWDDWLPLTLGPESATAHKYGVISWEPFEEDTAEKFDQMKEALRQADYISLASNRIYRVVPRLPQRYPMQTRYYQLLFAGKLGFRQVASFTSYPGLLGLTFVDADADESFTLYDHPQPILFAKERDLTDAEWDDLLGGSWKGAIPYYTGD